MFEYFIPSRDDLENYGASDPEPGVRKITAQSVSWPEKVDQPRSRQTIPIPTICRLDGGCCRRLVSLVFSSGTSVYSPSAVFNVFPQILTYTILSNPTPFSLLGS